MDCLRESRVLSPAPLAPLASAIRVCPLPAMPLIDKALFSITMNLVALRIPARKSATFMKRLDGHILRKPKLRPIISDVNDESGRLLLLSEDVVDLQLTALPDHLREYVLTEGAQPIAHALNIGYDFFNAEQVLRKLLPPEVETPTAFEQVGHVAHVNLREEHLPYKQMIGQVLLDKNPRLRTVVNKVRAP